MAPTGQPKKGGKEISGCMYTVCTMARVWLSRYSRAFLHKIATGLKDKDQTDPLTGILAV